MAAVWAIWLWLQSSKLWRRVGAITLTLSPAMLTTQQRVFGIAGKEREFSTNKLHNLRFGWSSNLPKTNKDYPRELQIDEDYKTIVLASGIAEEEATAVIARMTEIYSFPKYLPSDAAA
jgi:hypothetical protein